MRNIAVSTEVFSLIWARRQAGEENENEILARLLGNSAAPTTDSVEPGAGAESRYLPARDLVALRQARWWEVIRASLEDLGGKATLSQIYEKVRDLSQTSGRRIPTELEATIRGTLEDNCYSSKRYKGVRDIFVMSEGKWSGVWALKEVARK